MGDIWVFGFDDFVWVWEFWGFWFVFPVGIWPDLYQRFIFSLSQFNQSRFFVFVSQEDLWVWRLRFTLLEIGLVVGFMGLVVLLEIWVWFFVGDWFCRRFVFLWLLGFVLIWRLLCVLHVWLLRKWKKRNKNIDFYNFLDNELFEEEHEQFWGSEKEHEQLWKEHKEHDKGMIFQ